jgi:hypothetical protein
MRSKFCHISTIRICRPLTSEGILRRFQLATLADPTFEAAEKLTRVPKGRLNLAQDAILGLLTKDE